jgi:hypothetical protein
MEIIKIRNGNPRMLNKAYVPITDEIAGYKCTQSLGGIATATAI